MYFVVKHVTTRGRIERLHICPVVKCKDMNRTNIYVIIALTVSSPLLLSASSWASTASIVSITNSGSVQYSGSDLNTPINKAVYIYGKGSFTDAETSFIASHFTLLDVDISSFSQSSLQSIKTKNPSMKILGYKDMLGAYTYDDDWTTVNANEAWFVHDVYGNRLVSSQFGWYLMDVGSQRWRQHYVSYLNSKFSSTPEYDGVFADDVWDQLRNWFNPPFFTVPNSYIKPSDAARWHTDTVGMLQYVKANLLGGKILFVNTDESLTHDYLDEADGKMCEGAFHAPWEPFDQYPQAELGWTTSALDELARDMATGKIVWCGPGTSYPGTSPPNATTQSQIAATLKYCYAAFLCALNGTHGYFSFKAMSVDSYQDDGSKGYYPIMDTNIGKAKGAYYASENVYIRDFTDGKVLLNPSADSYIVNLGGNYQFMNGTVVSSIVLAPYTGEILMSST